MGKVFRVTFASSMTDLCEINSSFDKAVLRVCYTGENRNKSYISKDAITRSLKTIYNCPIVCNYDRDTDTFGGHDIELVRDDGGDMHIVNMTQPVGVIPESANTWFEEYEDENGVTHEYLYTDVLLWKRQEAYQKIKRDGVSAHSMEISIKEGQKLDGIYHINEFEFTAFALIGTTPCFESSALELFSLSDFKQQMSEMMQDLKDTFTLVNTSNEDDNKQNSMGGGEQTLDEKMELVAKYGIDVEALDFSIEDFTIEELTEKFESMKQADEAVEPDAAPVDGDPVEPADYELTGNVVEEIIRSISEETVSREWGESLRYCYVDCDLESSEIYAWDSLDWLLYGFSFSMNGDNVVIDYESKKRKKYVVADFDEGEQDSPFAGVFADMDTKIKELSEVEAKYTEATETITSMESELGDLKKFKADIEEANAEAERNDLFSKFEDLSGLESFESLRENRKDYSIEELEEKCFAIRGRQGTTAKFDLNQPTPIIPVVRHDEEYEPYGGLFDEYGNKD